jgi:hypothetical protein
LAIYSDSSNAPGLLKASSTSYQSYSSSSPNNANNYQFTFSGATLAAGTYWLELSTTGGQIQAKGTSYPTAVTQTGSYGSVTDYTATGQTMTNPMTVTNTNNVVWSLEVDGTLTTVPEPSTLVLLAGAFPFAGLGFGLLKVRTLRI